MIELLEQGKYAEVCAELEGLPDAGIGNRMMRARCYEGLGKLATALRWAEGARALLDPRDDARYKTVTEDIQRLSSRVGRLVIAVPTQALVTVDRVRLHPLSAVNVLPSDKGPHTVTASYDGKVFFEQAVLVEDGAETRIEVPAPPLPALPARGSSTSPGFVAGISLGIVGGLSLGAAGVLGGIAAAAEAPQDSRRARDAAIGLSISGGVLAVTGVVLALSSAKSRTPITAWLQGPLVSW